MLLLKTFVFCVLTITVKCELRKDQQYWKELAKNELDSALKLQWNLNTAKNVILFIGDGMGPNTVTAARIHKGGESHHLIFEDFPHVGLLKTYSADKMVPDSSCTATALLCGVKANMRTMGLDATVHAGDCEGSLQSEARVESLAALALKEGKSAGLVTTMRVTHATPGPVYAHNSERSWECEARMPNGTKCKDIARQMVEDWPGRDLQVILGGGRQMLVSDVNGTEADPLDTWSCISTDGRNLIEDYKKDKASRGLKHAVVSNNRDLGQLNVDDTDYLLGIFANGHLKYESERDKGPDGMPSIYDMTKAAINVLKKNEKGFFLMVEGGNIDFAHHRGTAKKAITEAIAMEEAVQLAISMTDQQDTLIIVTSDHTHTLSINGYQERGSNIFGVAKASPMDGIHYTTLSYATGGPGSFHFTVVNDADGQPKAQRVDATTQDTDSMDYEQVAGIMLDENSHGGGDVAVYARGPFAHLFHNVHEQHYVFQAICYAAKIGEYSSSSNSVVPAYVSLVFRAIALLV